MWNLFILLSDGGGDPDSDWSIKFHFYNFASQSNPI